MADIAPVERALLAIVRAVTEMSDEDGVGAGLLVLDEPTPFLPKRDVDRLFQLVRAVVAKGASVIFVSHDVDEVMEITDRATVLRDGKVAATIDTRSATKGDFIKAIVGRRLAPPTPPAPLLTRGPSHAVVHNLSGGTIEDFSLDLAVGRSRRRDRTDRIGLRRNSHISFMARVRLAAARSTSAAAASSSVEMTPRDAIRPWRRPGSGRPRQCGGDRSAARRPTTSRCRRSPRASSHGCWTGAR